MKRIYLDYASTTPLDPRALKSILPFLGKKFGNSVSLHSFGKDADEALIKSRETIAGIINAEPEEIIFTSSATESNNLAIKGIAFANKDKGRHIIVSSIEHEGVLSSSQWLEKQGFKISYLPVDKYGLIKPSDVKKTIRKDTILVSVMQANNEIGTIEPIGAIGKICRQKGVYFHTDASQSFGKIPIDVKKMKIDLLTASSHKAYGPKGAALLFRRKEVKIEPLIHGGGHEFGLRSSTVNIPAIVGFAKSAELAKKEMKKEAEYLSALRDKLIKTILRTIPGARLNGHPSKRLPNNVNFSFSFVEGEAIVAELDLAGIASSTASACASFKLEPSHVLLACGLSPKQAQGSLRLSLGRWTAEKEINYLVKILPQIIKKLRKISPFTPTPNRL